MATQIHKYEPTPAETKLINALANPANIGKNVTELCELAGISRKKYYMAFAKPEFVEYQEKFTRDLLKQGLLPVIRSLEKQAQKGSFYHQKLYLEMAGLYTEKAIREITGKDGGPVLTRVADLSDDELRKLTGK